MRKKWFWDLKPLTRTTKDNNNGEEHYVSQQRRKNSTKYNKKNGEVWFDKKEDKS